MFLCGDIGWQVSWCEGSRVQFNDWRKSRNIAYHTTQSGNRVQSTGAQRQGQLQSSWLKVTILKLNSIQYKREILMIATQEEMKANRVPLGFRDSCAHLLIPLNQCRLREFYLPWKCEDERYYSLD